MRSAEFQNPCAARQAAFTLVEIVVGLGLLSLIVALLFTVLSTAQQTVSESSRAADIHENARNALQFLRDELLRHKPPRNDWNANETFSPGQVFIIRNNPKGDGFDQLIFTTGGGTDAQGRPQRANVRYFVAEDPRLKVKVLKRQSFQKLTADPLLMPDPSTDPNASADPNDPKYDPTLDQNNEAYAATICEVVDQFDVQYLAFRAKNNKGEPDKFLPELGDDLVKDYNGRIWNDMWGDRDGVSSGMNTNQTSPPAIRITIVVREKLGRQKYMFQEVFLMPMNAYDLNTSNTHDKNS
jgi:type II secretory pathway pseudopilin PulG